MHMPHARVMLLLFGGAACMAAYWLRAGRIDAPLFSPTLFHTRSFAVGIFGNLFARLGAALCRSWCRCCCRWRWAIRRLRRA